ncbi:MAG: DUF4192 family protein [Microbacterium sp.]|nr:DUF4192 family protein [Microbacterium sp.]
MTTILRAADSAGLLRIVPSLAGFTPRNSLVLLPFHGSRTYGAMRIDLPSPSTSLVPYAETAIDLVTRVGGADAVAVIVYADSGTEHTHDGLVLPHDVLMDEVLGCAEDAGLRVADALCALPHGWASYLDDDPEIAPYDDSTPPAVPGLGDVTGDQLAGTALPRVGLAVAERVGRAFRSLEAGMCGVGQNASTTRDSPASAALALLDDPPALVERVLDAPDTLPTSETAALLWCLSRPLLRDAALTQWATDLSDGRRALAAQLACADAGVPVPERVARVFVGHGPTPDPDRLRLALTAVRWIVAAAPRSARPGPLAAAAWLSWALGRATHAGHYLGMALEIDPEHGLAGVLSTMLRSAPLPEWAFRRGPVAAAT